MTPPATARFRDALRSQARAYPWRESLVRMGADVLLVNASLLSAFALWFLFYVVLLRAPDPQRLATVFKGFVEQYWLFWTFLALLVFHLNGFYPHIRATGGVRIAAVVLRGVSLFIVSFVFADYFLFRGSLVPRGVAALGWVLTLAGVGGVRLVKHGVLALYRLEPRTHSDKVKDVLVLGGAGYLGSVVVEQLVRRGFRVRVLDSFLYGEHSLDTVRAHPHCELVHGDVRDIGVVVQAMRGCDAVVHLAAIVGDSACEENKPLAMEVNRAATRMLADVAHGCGVGRFVFASSCSVYGASDGCLDEAAALRPLSLYAQTKVDSENILLAARAAGFAPVILRFGTLFGLSARMRFDLVVNLFVARAATAGRISVLNGAQWRPFLHVRDAARAVIACLEAPHAAVSGEIFNVGSPALNLQIRALGEAVARAVPGTALDASETDDRRNYRVSFEKIERALGFACEETLAAGIGEIYAAIRSGLLPDFTTGQYNNQTTVRAFAKAAGAHPSPLRQLAALSRVEKRPA
jgi:nucleoside-diphosphate-sugar epimerase